MRYLIILFLLLSACSNQEPSVFVGFQNIYTTSPPRRDTTITENNTILAFTQDSLESIPLWQGCIIAPANRTQFELFHDEEKGRYILFDSDTLTVNVKHLKGQLFSIEIDKDDHPDRRYLAAVDKKLDLKNLELNERLTGKSFSFPMGGAEYTVSFHEENTCILTQRSEDEFITTGIWFVEQRESYFFLIIDGLDKNLKFQISDISNNFVDTYSFQNETRDKTRFTRLSTNQPPNNDSRWAAIPEEDNVKEIILSSPSKSWLSRNNFLVAPDTSTVSSLQSERDSMVFINWDSKVITADYNVTFSFDIISLDIQKIKVFPTEEDGRVNKQVYKTYQLINTQPR